MNYFFILSCLFAVCLTVSYSQIVVATSRSTARQTTGRPTATPSTGLLSCVCSCCSGLRCKPIALRSFIDTTCTQKACKDKCKVFEPKHCDHTFMGTNDAYCTVHF